MTTILIVEDEAIVAADLAGKLKQLGYEVAGTAATGEEAVELACRLLPGVVLMDIQLKGSMDGIEAAEIIHGRVDLPVIYLTAHSDSATLARAKLTEPFGYILKPFEERELSTNIEMALYKHRSDRQLREQREWLKVTLTSIGDAVITSDIAGRVTFLNPVAETLSGWSTEEAIGRPIQEVFRLIDEETDEAPEDPVVLVLRDGQPKALVNHTALVARDGRTIPIEDSAAPILDNGGRVIGAVLVFHDVTEKRRAAEALRKAHDELELRVEERTRDLKIANESVKVERQRLFDVLETLPAMICLLTPDYHVAFANRSFREKFGESGGRRCYEYCFGRTEPCTFCETYKVLETGEPHHWEVAVPDDGGFIDAYDFPFKDVDGSPLILEMDIDITKRKRAEAELGLAYGQLLEETEERQRLEEQLRHAQKMEAMGTLAGGIAHDFNNILASILGFTEMAIEDVPDRPFVKRSLQNALKSAMRARELVKQILAFSRKTNYERIPLSLSSLVKETVQLLRASIPATIEIRLSMRATYDTVLAAPVEIQQILMNIVTNASLAMEEAGGTVEVSVSDIDFGQDSSAMELRTAPDGYLQLSVKDTGIGMSPEVMKRVFEPFFTTREVGKGTGMGLAVVYGIVEGLGGTITVESELGVGSFFRVVLPRLRTEAKGEQPRAIPTPGGSERILFVDDEIMLVEWGQAALERLGYQVTALTDSKEALKAFSADPGCFDLVITDYAMAGMAGSQLSRELLSIRPDIPIILCTGHSEALSPEKAKEIGIREFLMKPLVRQELAQAIRRILDGEAE